MSEKEKKKLIECTIDVDGDGTIIAVIRCGKNKVRVMSETYKTKFILCSPECIKKSHVGFFKNNIWSCHYVGHKSTDPFVMLRELINELAKYEVIENV